MGTRLLGVVEPMTTVDRGVSLLAAEADMTVTLYVRLLFMAGCRPTAGAAERDGLLCYCAP